MFVVGTHVELVVTVAGNAPTVPVVATVKDPDGIESTVTLTLSRKKYVGFYQPTKVGTHEWTVDTGPPESVVNGQPFEVVARAAG
jgi:hypothetical protein